MDATDLELLARFMEWADRRTLDSVRDVPSEVWECRLAASFGSLAGTVEHLFAAEWTWLERVEGRSPAGIGPRGGARDRRQLAELWPPVWSGWLDVAARRAPDDIVRYRTTQGATHETPVGNVLLHLSHHSAAYRGQVVALLRALGGEPVSTDLIAMLRSRPDAVPGG